MTTQKKSLLSKMKTTKKAIVASDSEAKPTVATRAKAYVSVHGHVNSHVAARPKH